MASKSGGRRKHGRKKRKPSFMRYKASNRAEERKIRNMMRQNGMTRNEVIAFRHRQHRDG